MLDARKALRVLNSEWDGCTKCHLGQYRQMAAGEMVFGEGVDRGIMFIGEGPGWEEEKHGRPFIGASGKVLRAMIERLQITNYYITNIVACRSCEQARDGGGQLQFRYDKMTRMQVPRMMDTPPTDAAIQACISRVHEEIYLIDPVVIVTLGGVASKALFKRNVTITKERGNPTHILVPGAGFRASLTEKRRAWERKVHGELVRPVDRSEVRYVVVPTIHPAFVLRHLKDQDKNGPKNLLARDINLAARIYDRYMQETYGTAPTRPDNDEIPNIQFDEEYE